jgi:hypothetical protein
VSKVNQGAQKAIILWLGGVGYTAISTFPEVEALVKRGVLLELEPAMITSPLSQYYQAFGGRLPSRFGFFDSLIPACRLSSSSRDVDGYSLVEDFAGRDTPPKMLPDLLRTEGWTVFSEETSPTTLASCLRGLPQIESSSPIGAIVKCSGDSDSDWSQIEDAICMASAWVGEMGLLAILSEMHPATVESFINVNNFLVELGVMEVDEQSGGINWPNSLAYFAGGGQLWVNLQGRDPQGAVHPGYEYEEVRGALVKALPTKLRAMTGAEVIERVYRKEELYPGDYLFCAPDLVIQFKPGYAPSKHSMRLEFDEAVCMTPVGGSSALAGVHPSSVEGFLLASSPVLALEVAKPLTAPLVAVVPTLLHALNSRYVDMDSPAIAALFSPTYLEAHPIPTATHLQKLSDEEEELVINRLRDLGYV